jgi:hypothetical protein
VRRVVAADAVDAAHREHLVGAGDRDERLGDGKGSARRLRLDRHRRTGRATGRERRGSLQDISTSNRRHGHAPRLVLWPSVAARPVLGDHPLESREEVRVGDSIALGEPAGVDVGQDGARLAPGACRNEASFLVKILRSLPAVRMPRPRDAVTCAGGIGRLELASRLAVAAGCAYQTATVPTFASSS